MWSKEVVACKDESQVVGAKLYAYGWRAGPRWIHVAVTGMTYDKYFDREPTDPSDIHVFAEIHILVSSDKHTDQRMLLALICNSIL